MEDPDQDVYESMTNSDDKKNPVRDFFIEKIIMEI